MNTIVSSQCTTHISHVKKRLRNHTIITGGTVSSYYFISHGISLGLSSFIGAASSVAYVHLLSTYVENIESAKFQKQLLVPVSMTLTECLWNNYSGSVIELDYLTTIVGFFAYKLALFGFVFDVIKDDLSPIDNTIDIQDK
tara:strand:- start:3450 stop:3872 length:423 start_codon:yes stop_codon:yes gene_type:complete